MAHEHHSEHIIREDASGYGAGMGFIVAFATIILLAVLALAVLFAVQPWDDEGGVTETPITDDSGGGAGSNDAPAQ